MAHCPYCLSPVSKKDIVCSTCGAEKGYLYLNRRPFGLALLLLTGLLVPWAAVVAVLFYLKSGGMPLWLTAVAALGLLIFTIQRLVVGPRWYR